MLWFFSTFLSRVRNRGNGASYVPDPIFLL